MLNKGYSTADAATFRTTPLIIGVVVGLIDLLVGGSGLIVAGVTVKKLRYDLNPSNYSVFSHCPVSTQSIVC